MFSLLTPMAIAEEETTEKKPKVQKKKTGIFALIDKRKKRAALTQAVMNAKQVYYLMIEFDNDFGAFPSDDTAKAHKDLKGYTGKHSNDYLAQFLAGGYVQSEEIFYVLGGSKTKKKPDNDTTTKAKTLEAGECGFAYVIGQSTSKNSALPLLCAPMTGKGTKFDREALGGKAMVLRIDGSVVTYDIEENGDVLLKNGKNLFADGLNSHWGVGGFHKDMLLFPK